MRFDSSRSPADISAPPTLDEVAASFGVPLITLVQQDSVEETGVGLQTESEGWGDRGERTVMEAASISYTLWRNPADHADPANLADLPEQTRAALDDQPAGPLPDWLVRARERMRYPMLWEAVRTTHFIDDSFSDWHPPEFALVEHVNHILLNTFRDERTDGRLPGRLTDPATEDQLERATVNVDGRDVPGLRIGSDRHVLGLGADLGERLLTAVIAREHLPYIRVAFVTRPAPQH